MFGLNDFQFNPFSLNPHLWLKSTDVVTSGSGSTNFVLKMFDARDRNKDGVNVGEPTLVSGQINGYPVVRFDGVDDYIQCSNLNITGTALTTVLVTKVRLPADDFGRIVSLSSGGFDDFNNAAFCAPFLTFPPIQLDELHSYRNNLGLATTYIKSGQFNVLTSMWKGDNVHYSYSDFARFTGADNGGNFIISRCWLGGSPDTQNANCDIAELLVFDRALDQNRELFPLITYLKGKYSEAGAGFSPYNFGPAVWTVADDLQENVSGVVTFWRNRMGTTGWLQNNLNFKPWVSNRTYNGHRALQFTTGVGGTSSGRYMDYNAAEVTGLNPTGATLFFVGSVRGSGHQIGFADFGSDTVSNHFFWVDSHIYESSFSNARKDLGVPVVNTSEVPFVYTVSSANSDWHAWINGVSQFATTTNTFSSPTGYLLGIGDAVFNFGWVGDCMEVIVYPRVLTNAERQLIEKHLILKYGIN